MVIEEAGVTEGTGSVPASEAAVAAEVSCARAWKEEEEEDDVGVREGI